jgi:hypothetical protein
MGVAAPPLQHRPSWKRDSPAAPRHWLIPFKLAAWVGTPFIEASGLEYKRHRRTGDQVKSRR